MNPTRASATSPTAGAVVADPWEFAAAEFDPKADYLGDPVLWGKDKLHEFYWSMQRQILESLRDERYTAVQSCHDAGKSFIAARAVAHWIDQHPPGEAFVVTTAPTAAQVDAILWREIGKAHAKGDLIGTITGAGYPKWKLKNGELVGYGRKPADYSESAFQGIHARYVLIVMDEANGIDRSLFDAVDALATNEFARVLAIGNPDDPTSHFANVCKPDSGWNVLRIDGLRTPNMTEAAIERLVDPSAGALGCRQCIKEGARRPLLARLMESEGIGYSTEDIPEQVRPMLLSPLWVEERLHRWVGRPAVNQNMSELAAQSAIFTSKVRGLFPDRNTEGVIPLGWVERAIDRHRDWVAAGRPALVGRQIIGGDIAREGEDETAVAVRMGPCVQRITQYRQADTMEATGFIVAAMTQPQSLAVVDVIGVGAGVVDRLREMHVSVRPFNAAKSAENAKDRSGEFGFINLRALAWWNLREMLDPSRGATLMLPDDELLKADLVSPRYSVKSGGKIQIESKDDIRKRLGRSTDKGDAVVMACWPDAGAVGAGADDSGAVSWWSSPADLGLDEDAVIRWTDDTPWTETVPSWS